MPHTISGSSSGQKYAPKWLRQRALGDCNRANVPQVSLESMRRLKLETTLEGHSSCVNCLEWNKSGDLLASGSDDRNVILWDPFKATNKRTTIKTNHQGNIFSIKFMPEFSDNLVATCASDGAVSITNILANETVLDCKSCHANRVKRLAVHPNQPTLLWSASEDGYIMEYDIREPHTCNATRPKTLLIDLKQASTHCNATTTTKSGAKTLAAKCLAVNPMRDEMLALGSNDVFVRLFDRRHMRQKGWGACMAQFSPGHMLKPNLAHLNGPRSFGATYVTFSPDGTELLANLHGEHIYLYNTYDPFEGYKSFETIRPLMEDKSCDAEMISSNNNNNNNYKFTDMFAPTKEANNKVMSKTIKPRTLWSELQTISCDMNYDSPKKHRDYYMSMAAKLRNNQQFNKTDFDKLNEMLLEFKNCAELYLLRASGLLNRDWIGDAYQAVRDCCCALAFQPRDITAVRILISAINLMGDSETLEDFFHFLKDHELGDSILSFDDSPVEMMSDFRPTLDHCNMELFDYLYDGSTGLRLDPFVSAQTCSLDSVMKEKILQQEHAHDYTKRFCGHCNLNTDIKEANFFGYGGEFIVAGSDDGAFYIYDKSTTNLVKAVQADMHILNCLQPHPSICMLATSGIEPTVKLWSPTGKTCHDVSALEQRCTQNQEFIATDPMEAMIMMLYPSELQHDGEEGDI